MLATPDYWAEACKHLVKKDRVMKRLISQFGDAALQTRGDPFITLARSIVGQQVSVASAQAVWERFAALPRSMKPGHVLKLKIDDMRAERLREFRHRRGSSECNPSAAAAIPSSPASINSNDDGVTII